MCLRVLVHAACSRGPFTSLSNSKICQSPVPNSWNDTLHCNVITGWLASADGNTANRKSNTNLHVPCSKAVPHQPTVCHSAASPDAASDYKLKHAHHALPPSSQVPLSQEYLGARLDASRQLRDASQQHLKQPAAQAPAHAVSKPPSGDLVNLYQASAHTDQSRRNQASARFPQSAMPLAPVHKQSTKELQENQATAEYQEKLAMQSTPLVTQQLPEKLPLPPQQITSQTQLPVQVVPSVTLQLPENLTAASKVHVQIPSLPSCWPDAQLQYTASAVTIV